MEYSAWESRRLSDIGQGDLDRLAASKGDVAASTVIRQIYTPAAVLNFAASDAGGKLCAPVRFRTAKVRTRRADYLHPAEVEARIESPPHPARLVAFLVGTGCRITEAIELEWRDVPPGDTAWCCGRPRPTTHAASTWAYACTHDLTFVRQQGGWRSLSTVERYTRAGSADLASAVLDHGWEFLGREVSQKGVTP